MKSDKSSFYNEIYDNLKSSKEKVKKENFKEVASAAELTLASFLLDIKNEAEEMLQSVNDYCGV